MTEGPAPGMKAERFYAGIRMNSVAILDRSLQKWYVVQQNGRNVAEHGKVGKIAVEKTGVSRTATNTLQVYTVLRNRTNYPLQVQARVQFFDQSEVPIEGPSSWQRLMLDPQSVVAYKEFSTRTDCHFYYIEIREGR
ncbi:MAG: hypothetical protein ABFS19_12725 [Thermodesulfobacteriota bacterium]